METKTHGKQTAPGRHAPAKPPCWSDAVVARATHLFETAPWPDRTMESYRRTDLSAFPFDSFAPVESSTGGTGGEVDAPHIPGPTLSFEGGRCVSAVQDFRSDEDGAALVAPLERLSELDPAIGSEAARLSGQVLERFSEDRIALWHLRDLRYGACIVLPAGRRLTEPIRIRFAFSKPLTHYTPHVVIVAGEGSEGTVAVSFSSSDDVVVNAQVVSQVATGGKLTVVTLQELSEGSTFFSHEYHTVMSSATFHHHAAWLGGILGKGTMVCNLGGAGADARLSGVFFARGSQHPDVRVEQVHQAPHTTSRACYKGAVRDNANSVFQGLIAVGDKAAGTDAYLTSKNLVLSSGARADSIPSLQINTNDVRCSHGSTTSRIDENELFYLMSRGLSRTEARRLLVSGFFDEMLDQVPFGLAQDVRAAIEQRID